MSFNNSSISGPKLMLSPGIHSPNGNENSPDAEYTEGQKQESLFPDSDSSIGLSQNIEEKKRNEENQTKRNSEYFSRNPRAPSSFHLTKQSNISFEDLQSQDLNKTNGGRPASARLMKRVSFMHKKKLDDKSVKKEFSFNDHQITNNIGLNKTYKAMDEINTQKVESPSKNPVNGLQVINKVKSAISSLRQRAGIQDIKNLRQNQANIINDWSFYQKCEEEEVDDPLVQALMFQKLVWNKTIQLAEKIGKKINSPLRMLYFHVPLEITYKMMNKIPALRPNSNFKLVVEFFKFLMIVVNIFVITVSLSFDQSYQSVLFSNCEVNETFILWIWFVFGFFCFDVAVKINTGFYELGVAQLDRRVIFTKYLKNDFRYDFVSFVPLTINLMNFKAQMISEGNLRYIYLLFFFKYLDLQKIIATIEQYSFVDELNEAFYSLFALTAQTLTISHIIACFWHLIAYKDNSHSNWLISSGLKESSWQTKYYFSVYWALTTMITIGYGDITAQNESEVLFCICAMLIGCAVFAYSINHVGFILEKIIKRNHELKYKKKKID